MGKTTFKTLFAAALVGVAALTLAAPAEAGGGWGRGGYGHGGWGGGPRYYHGGGYYLGGGGDAWAAGLLGLGVGAIIGSALTPQTVYVAPPGPPAPAYAPVAYGPPPWTPDWYSYCYSRYRTFNPRTGYFVGYDGVAYFCR
jgi:BA14K-like protein